MNDQLQNHYNIIQQGPGVKNSLDDIDTNVDVDTDADATEITNKTKKKKKTMVVGGQKKTNQIYRIDAIKSPRWNWNQDEHKISRIYRVGVMESMKPNRYIPAKIRLLMIINRVMTLMECIESIERNR